MQEIFADINDRTRSDVYSLFVVVSHMTNLQQAIKIITLYRNSLTEQEQEFMDFVFKVYMEEHNIDESNIN